MDVSIGTATGLIGLTAFTVSLIWLLFAVESYNSNGLIHHEACLTQCVDINNPASPSA